MKKANYDAIMYAFHRLLRVLEGTLDDQQLIANSQRENMGFEGGGFARGRLEEARRLRYAVQQERAILAKKFGK